MSRSLVRSRSLWAAIGAVVVGLTVLAVSAGTANAVANGEPVPDGKYPFSTKLTMPSIPRADGTTYSSACSASLVAPQWIITAGHCFHDVNGNRVSGVTPYATTATIGRTDLTNLSVGYDVAVDRVLQNSREDVALGHLATAVPITPLPLSPVAPKAGQILRITGWGATSSVNPTPVTWLQTGQVKIKRVANTSVYVVGYLPSLTTSACLWDSGAPYFSEASNGAPALVSVEVDGPNCPHSQEETTAGIDKIADWIRQNAV
jgi:secreted trypsin-like serine protease